MSLKLAAQASLANDPAPKICRRSYTAVSVFSGLAPGKPKPQILDENPQRLRGVGVLLTRRDDYLPVNLLYRHRQAGRVNLAGDHSLLIDLCSLYRSFLGRDVTFALTFVPRGRIRQIGMLKDSVQAALLGRFCFWSKGVRRPV